MDKNRFLSIENWLLEKKKEEKPLYGCVMMDPKKIKGWKEVHLAGIDEDDLYEPDNDDYGLEEQPHITIVYGIHEDEVDPSVVVDMMEQKMLPVKVQISEIDFFENKEYDVIKYNVPVTEQLQEYRDMFMDAFENTQTFSGYNPHITIAYVKKGNGKKYKKTLDEPFDVIFIKGVYSYHKENAEEGDELIRRVVNLEPKDDRDRKNDIIKSKPFKKS